MKKISIGLENRELCETIWEKEELRRRHMLRHAEYFKQ